MRMMALPRTQAPLAFPLASACLAVCLMTCLMACQSGAEEKATGTTPATAPVSLDSTVPRHPEDLAEMRATGGLRVLLRGDGEAHRGVDGWLPALAKHLNITIHQVHSGAQHSVDILTAAGARRLPRATRSDNLLRGLVEGRADLVIEPLADNKPTEVLFSRPVDPGLSGRPDAVKISSPRYWAMRKGAVQLKDAIDEFLFARTLSPHKHERYLADLNEIRRRGVIRVAMLNNGASYFVYRGQEVGFQYELAALLALRLGVRLRVVSPSKPDSMPELLSDGLADVIPYAPTTTGDALTTTSPPSFRYSSPLTTADYVLVQPAGEPPITTAAGLAHRRVHLRRASRYWPVLALIQSAVPGLELVAADEASGTESLIDAVGRGQLPLTVSNSALLAMELTWRDDVQGSLILSQNHPLTYAVSATAPRLRERINRFASTEPQRPGFRALYQKYFSNRERMAVVRSEEFAVSGRISPYDDLARKYGRQYAIDWRLILAQMYQESRFDPEARSWAGARGLMQLMPRTAEELGVKKITDPQENVAAGVRYLAGLIKRFGKNADADMPMRQRIRFALASYNAGHSHVRDARRLAAQLNLNPDRWFGNVEKAIVLLEQPKYHKKAASGYCRGREPVAYVSRIQSKFDAYSAFSLEHAKPVPGG